MWNKQKDRLLSEHFITTKNQRVYFTVVILAVEGYEEKQSKPANGANVIS